MQNTFGDFSSIFAGKCHPKVFFAGIGGVGMAGLAQWARDLGYLVSGMDQNMNKYTERLRKQNVMVSVGSGELPEGEWDACVYSLALDENDPLIRSAKARGVPLLSRAAFLGLLSGICPLRVGISGTHGKSTVTAMTAGILQDAGYAPTVLCGAELPGGGVYRRGGGEALVYEACEYRDSFLCTRPTVAVVNNLDFDHPDWFRNREDVERAFSAFVGKPEVSMVVLNAADPATPRLRAAARAPVITFGGEGDVTAGDVFCRGERNEFDLYIKGVDYGRVRLAVLGAYNRDNALAAAATALACGAPPSGIATSLSAFAGIGGRMQPLGRVAGVRVYADYGHHPTEITAALAAARELAGEGRLLCVFQPHTYSRTAALLSDFARALGGADRLAVMEVFAAREKENAAASGKVLAAASGGDYAPDAGSAAEWVMRTAENGDLLLLLGAGRAVDVWERLTRPDLPAERISPAPGSCRRDPPSPPGSR